MSEDESSPGHFIDTQSWLELYPTEHPETGEPVVHITLPSMVWITPKTAREVAAALLVAAKMQEPKPPASLSSLGATEWQALCEIVRWPASQPYWHRKASMAKLEALGLVRRLLEHTAPSRPAYAVTDAGKSHAQAYVMRRNSRVIGNAQGRKS